MGEDDGGQCTDVEGKDNPGISAEDQRENSKSQHCQLPRDRNTSESLITFGFFFRILWYETVQM